MSLKKQLIKLKKVFLHYQNSDIKNGSVLVHCGAGVSRVCFHFIKLVFYFSHRIFAEIQENGFYLGFEVYEIKETSHLSKLGVLAAVEIFLKIA